MAYKPNQVPCVKIRMMSLSGRPGLAMFLLVMSYTNYRTQPIGHQAYGAAQIYAKHKDNDRLSFLPVLEMYGFSIFVVQVVQQ